MRIDVQCHIFPNSLKEALIKNNYPKCFPIDGGTMCDFGSQKLIMPEIQYKPENIIAAMDKGSVDIALISANIPDPGFLDPNESPAVCTKINLETKEIEDKANGRFFSIGILPWNNPKSCTQELSNLLALGMKGVMLFTRNGSLQVDDNELESVYDAIEASGLPIFIHPTVPLWHEPIGDYSMVANVSFVMDTAYAFMRLCYSGILDRHPGLKVIIPHAGGVLPILDGRLTYVPPATRRFIDPNKRTVIETLRSEQVWFDLANPSENVLKYFKDYMGLDRAMYGKDYPFCEQDFLTNMIDNIGLSKEEMEKVSWKNANELFRLGIK